MQKEKTKKEKQMQKEIICTYCGKKSYYLYHRNKKNKVDFAICFKCLKNFFDKILGEAKDGGRISHE